MATKKWQDHHDREGLLQRLDVTRNQYLRGAPGFCKPSKPSSSTASQLSFRGSLNNAAALSDALGAHFSGKSLIKPQARMLSLWKWALSGLVDGVIGVDLETLCASDSSAYCDTFWLSKIARTAEIHKVGAWNAMAAANGLSGRGARP